MAKGFQQHGKAQTNEVQDRNKRIHLPYSEQKRRQIDTRQALRKQKRIQRMRIKGQEGEA